LRFLRRRQPPTAKVSAAGEVYEKVVEAALASEEDRRKTVEGRGATIVATSTTMLTLVFALTAVVTGKDYAFKDQGAISFLTLALVAFVFAALLAIIVQAFGVKYYVIGDKTLEGLTGELIWHKPEDDARRMWINRQVETIVSLRKGNNRKATLAIWALAFEVSAIALLTISLLLELHGRVWPWLNLYLLAHLVGSLVHCLWPYGWPLLLLLVL
jgi:hypothetical protein